MKLKRLRVENIRSYKLLDISFKDGVSVVSGVNGSGKTSLLESCFIGIFGSSALSKDFKIENIIRKGAKNSKIILEFEQNGKNCLINREFSAGKTKNSIMRIDGKTIEGANLIYDATCKLLGMNEESYTNCVYVKQGEIDVLINAKPKDRQRMIDDLLQIGKLEEYRERVKEAITGIRRSERDRMERQKNIEKDIEEIKVNKPHKQLKFENEKYDSINNDIDKINKIKDSLRLEIDSLNTQIKEYRGSEQKKVEFEKEIKNINSKILSTQHEIESNRKEIHTNESNISVFEQEILKYITNLKKSYEYLTLKHAENVEENIKEIENEEREVFQSLTNIKKEIDIFENDRNIKTKKIEENNQKKEKNEKNIIEKIKKIKDNNLNIQNYEKSINKLECVNNQSILKIQELGYKEYDIDGIKDRLKKLTDDDKCLQGVISELLTKINGLDKKIQDKQKVYEKDKKSTNKKIEENNQKKEKNENNIIELNKKIEENNQKKEKNEKYIKELNNENNQSILNIQKFDVKEVEINDIKYRLKKLTEECTDFYKIIVECSTKIDRIGKDIQNEKDLLEKGKCPTCNQDLKGSIIETKIHNHETKKSLLEKEYFNNEKNQNYLLRKIECIELEVRKIEKNNIKINDIQNKINSDKKLFEEYANQLKEKKTELKYIFNEKDEMHKLLKNIELQFLEKKEEQEKFSLEKKYFDSKKKQHKINININNMENAKHELEKIKENNANIKITQTEINSKKQANSDYNNQIKELRLDLQLFSDKNKELLLSINEINKRISSYKIDENNYTKLHTKTQDKLKILKKIQKSKSEINKHQNNIINLRNENKNKIKIKTIFEEQVYEKEDNIKEIETKLKASNIESLKSNLYKFKKGFAEIELDIKNQNFKKDEIVSIIGAIREKLNRLDVLESNKEKVEKELIYINTVNGNAQELETMYMRLRGELRARSIGALDTYLNEMFSFMYSNNAYSHIKLDSDYNLIIYEKDGIELEPKLLSGGERAILNLVFRCAIYRLLSKETLPPLILDEPTVFLDKGHVNQLIKLIDMMGGRYGVKQILIVSHDESLLDSADHTYKVEKDLITNISSIGYLN